MILIGRYLSPFVRRVGMVLEHYGIEFEVGELDAFRRTVPVG